MADIQRRQSRWSWAGMGCLMDAYSRRGADVARVRASPYAMALQTTAAPSSNRAAAKSLAERPRSRRSGSQIARAGQGRSEDFRPGETGPHLVLARDVCRDGCRGQPNAVLLHQYGSGAGSDGDAAVVGDGRQVIEPVPGWARCEGHGASITGTSQLPLRIPRSCSGRRAHCAASCGPAVQPHTRALHVRPGESAGRADRCVR